MDFEVLGGLPVRSQVAPRRATSLVAQPTREAKKLPLLSAALRSALLRSGKTGASLKEKVGIGRPAVVRPKLASGARCTR